MPPTDPLAKPTDEEQVERHAAGSVARRAAPNRGGGRSARTRAATALLLGCVACAACAVRNYTPPSFPTFLDQSAAETTPAAVEEGLSGQPAESAHPPSAATATDANTAAPNSVTLAEAVAECLAADPRIRAGAEVLQQARADLWTASLLPNPTLGTGVSLFPLGQPFTVNAQGGPPQFDVGLAFPIDWLLFGKRAAAVDTARAGVDVAAAEFADLVRQRLAATVSAFFDVLKAKAMLDLARQDLESFQRLEQITADLVRLGGSGTIENDRVHVLLLDSQREVRRREADLAIAKSALLSQLGRSGSQRRFDVEGQLDVPSPVPPISAQRAFRLAEEYRPDVVAARRRVEQATAEAHRAETEAYPEVAPHAGYTRQFQSKAIGFPDVNAWGAGVELSLPVFDRNQGNIEKARSALAQSGSELRTRMVEVRAEIEEASRDYRFAYEAVTTDAPRRIEAARNARDKIETAYRVGGRPLIDVLDAQRTFRDIQRVDVEDRAGYWQSLYRLNAAVGKEVLR
jgi:cobalt-zinc-cadmium efflux system outer membrane protein